MRAKMRDGNLGTASVTTNRHAEELGGRIISRCG